MYADPLWGHAAFPAMATGSADKLFWRAVAHLCLPGTWFPCSSLFQRSLHIRHHHLQPLLQSSWWWEHIHVHSCLIYINCLFSAVVINEVCDKWLHQLNRIIGIVLHFATSISTVEVEWPPNDDDHTGKAPVIFIPLFDLQNLLLVYFMSDIVINYCDLIFLNIVFHRPQIIFAQKHNNVIKCHQGKCKGTKRYWKEWFFQTSEIWVLLWPSTVRIPKKISVFCCSDQKSE